MIAAARPPASRATSSVGSDRRAVGPPSPPSRSAVRTAAATRRNDAATARPPPRGIGRVLTGGGRAIQDVEPPCEPAHDRRQDGGKDERTEGRRTRIGTTVAASLGNFTGSARWRPHGSVPERPAEASRGRQPRDGEPCADVVHLGRQPGLLGWFVARRDRLDDHPPDLIHLRKAEARGSWSRAFRS